MAALLDGVDLDALVGGMLARARRLYPLCRSITGPGVRETLAAVGEHLELTVHEVPTGTPVLDWTVPKEWRIRAAWIDTPDGRRVADFATSNLHVVGYSVPVDARVTFDELRPHLHSLPDRPSLVPYRTAYYADTWGFCLAHDVLESLPRDGEYHVVIDSELVDGSLTYGEVVVRGELDAEIVVSTHVCHPSLANDNLSGITVLTALGELLAAAPRRRYTHRLLFVPSTIGAITWLARNRDVVDRVAAVIVLAGLGDPHPPSWKRSRRGGTLVDRAMEHVLRHRAPDCTILDFYPYGYDERQFGSPGFDLAAGRLARGVHGEYPEYHTSADDLSFIDPGCLRQSTELLCAGLDVLDGDHTYRNTAPYGEPRLGPRGLYSAVGGALDRRSYEMGLLWVLSYSDGEHSLLDIADRAGLPFEAIREAADRLVAAGLLA
jgi:aminopeptidase-like protein